MSELKHEIKVENEVDENDVIALKDVFKVFKNGHVRNYALDGITISVPKGKTMAVVGESGSGKTTLGQVSIGLSPTIKGKIYFHGRDLSRMRRQERREFRSKTHAIFQDPYSSLNPYNTIYQSVAAPLISFRGDLNREQKRDFVSEMLDKVGLSPGKYYLDTYPKTMSGGQRQRVSIARSLINRPEFIVADEPTSMLDVSITSTVINIMKSLKKEMDFTMLYISHEIATSRYIADIMAVMNLGRIVEYGDPDEITKRPMHPYTDLLIRSLPRPGHRVSQVEGATLDFNYYNGGIKGCTFSHFCPFKTDECLAERPELTQVGPSHWVACFHPLSK